MQRQEKQEIGIGDELPLESDVGDRDLCRTSYSVKEEGTSDVPYVFVFFRPKVSKRTTSQIQASGVLQWRTLRETLITKRFCSHLSLLSLSFYLRSKLGFPALHLL